MIKDWRHLGERQCWFEVHMRPEQSLVVESFLEIQVLGCVEDLGAELEPPANLHCPSFLKKHAAAEEAWPVGWATGRKGVYLEMIF